MMIEEYPKYFQKSLFFLYPLLNIKGSDVEIPKNTYLILEGYIDETDYKLICHFEKVKGFGVFEIKHLYKNKYFLKEIPLDKFEDESLYIFDLTEFKDDVDLFLKGKYSKISKKSKDKIINFYSQKSNIYTYIKSFLYPEEFYDEYSEVLKVPLSYLKEVEELSDVYNRDKETCILKLKKNFGK